MKKAVVAMLFAMVLSVVSTAFAQEAAPAAADQAAPAAAAQEAAPAAEAPAPAQNNLFKMLAPIGCGFIMIGAGLGIGRIGGSAVDAMARQPEAASAIQTAMILAAALIEGATLFGLVICMLLQM